MDEWVWVHDGSEGRTKPEEEGPSERGSDSDIEDDMESEASNDGELGRSCRVGVVLALFVGAIMMIAKSLV